MMGSLFVLCKSSMLDYVKEETDLHRAYAHKQFQIDTFCICTTLKTTKMTC